MIKEIVGYVKIKQDNFPKRLLIDSKELQTVKVTQTEICLL